MNLLNLIERKQKDPQAIWTQQEIEQLIQDYTKGLIPDYQMSAALMLIYFLDLSAAEVADLTLAMAKSGDQLDLSAIAGTIVDKHSTGGVGDTTTLVLAPWLASCGVPVAKMSGRGLGHTGGTVDKLEAIPGFRSELSQQEFIDQVNRIGVAVIGQTGDIAPADKKIYALRDVTSTVQSIPLIASSIMSKKLAAGADAIVLDVKVGNGAFMTDLTQATELAQTMIDIGNHTNRNTRAVISDMNQPLGHAVGNLLEVKEAIATLQGEGPQDLLDLCLALGEQMLLASDIVTTKEAANELLLTKLKNGSAFNKLVELVQAQGGDPNVIHDPTQLATAPYQVDVLAPSDGYLSSWQTHAVGDLARELGAGRLTKETQIDPTVGLEIHAKVGAQLTVEETVIATIHSASQDQLDQAVEALHDCYTIAESVDANDLPTLIHRVIA